MRYSVKWSLAIVIGLLVLACGGGSLETSQDSESDASGTTMRSTTVATSVVSDTDDSAPEYPHSSMQIIVPFGAGGGVDTLARGLATYLPKYIDGLNVIVENWPGGGSREGSARFQSEAVADGEQYIFIVEASTIGTQVVVGGEFDVTEWEPIAAISSDSLFLAVSDSGDYVDLEDLVEAGQQGELLYSSSGPGSLLHIQAVILAEALGLSATHVPFDGSAEAARALIGGDVDFMIAELQNLTQYEGIRPLALIPEERDDRLPDTPTLSELGYDVPELTSTRGWFAPPGTSPQIVEALERATRAVFDDPEFQAWAEDAGFVLNYFDSEEWSERVMNFAAVVTEYRDLVQADMN